MGHFYRTIEHPELEGTRKTSHEPFPKSQPGPPLTQLHDIPLGLVLAN